jgi:hypothetical protein
LGPTAVEELVRETGWQSIERLDDRDGYGVALRRNRGASGACARGVVLS